MIAMDVVDTLRHDESLVERELDDSARRRNLIDRLREIYRGQGIEVPDRILEEGVRALEEDRFTYKPPDPDALSTRLAKLYVTRCSWGRWAAGLVIGVIAVVAVNYIAFERPRDLRIAAEQHELTGLPATIERLVADIRTESADPLVAARAEGIGKSAVNAARAGNLTEARSAREELRETLESLRSVYDIRIVNRPGEVSGLWRIPDANPDALNFYVVVEAVAADGGVIRRTVTNEETGKRETVTSWAQRVDRQVLVDVKADKEDDGIIQNNVVGRKMRGQLEPEWTIPVRGGAITRW